MIKYGRCLLAVLVTLELALILVYFGIKMAELNFDERDVFMGKFSRSFTWDFFSLSLVLFLCVFFLINRLKKKKDQLTSSQVDKEFFNKEICTLLAILIIFSSTYMLRSLWDLDLF